MMILMIVEITLIDIIDTREQYMGSDQLQLWLQEMPLDQSSNSVKHV